MKADGGFVTIQFISVVALSLLLFTGFANLVVVQYARGVVRSSLDEGVRDGSRASSGPRDCEETAATFLDGLLGGSMGDGVEVSCSEVGSDVLATAQVRFDSWFPGVPSWQFEMEATMVKEIAP
jgi:hypothetical protein